MTRPNLLYISPVAPRPTGNGLAMRAYHVLEFLSRAYRVHLLVVRMRPGQVEVDPSVLVQCEKAVILPVDLSRDIPLRLRHFMYKHLPALAYTLYSKPSEWAYVTERRIGCAASVFAGVSFHVVHVFRLYMQAFSGPFWTRDLRSRFQLDLDDIESETRKSLGRLYDLNRETRLASLMRREAELYEGIERETLPAFDRVFVCSEADRETLEGSYGCRQVEVVPNVVQIPQGDVPQRRSSLFTFLFVGTFGYYPNADGLLFFSKKVLPCIRKAASEAFRITVAGGGMPKKARCTLADFPEIKLRGYVDDLAPLYREADAVIVPVRGGGGTRIKVLEAFSFRKPVVSTSTGVEGIRVEPGRDVLIGDTPEEFAGHCLSVMKDPQLRERLSRKRLQARQRILWR